MSFHFLGPLLEALRTQICTVLLNPGMYITSTNLSGKFLRSQCPATVMGCTWRICFWCFFCYQRVLNGQIWPCVKSICVIQFLISKIMSVLHLCSLCEHFLSQDIEGMCVLCKLWLRKQVCMFEELGTAWDSFSIQCVGSNSGWTSQTASQAKLAGSL